MPALREGDVRVEWSVRIPLRDGIHLSATLYRPAHQIPPPPVICTITPYVGQTSHDVAFFFATHGYPFLTVDVRGRGNSEGSFHPINETRDGYDVIEWLARQPWCNGQVAMWGGSYSGYTQWATAKSCPPHLATIVPVAAPYRGVDSPVRNNIFVPYTLQWLTLVAGHTSQDKNFADERFWRATYRRFFESGAPFSTLDTFAGNPSTLFHEWISHPHADSYWDTYNPTPDEYARLSVPILTITGSHDGNQSGALAHYHEYMKSASATGRARHYLVIGPWDHAGTRAPKREFAGISTGPASMVDLGRLHLDWYAWTMQGGPKPQFLQKNVAWYVMGSEQWRYADTLEAITTHSAPLYLGSRENPTDVFHSGFLHTRPPESAEPDHFTYDPRDLSGAGLETDIDPYNLTDQRLLHAFPGRQLVYHSAPVSTDVEISGFFKVSLWISIDQADTDLRVSLHELDIRGGSILLTGDTLRARYRESFREARLVQTTEPLRYDFTRFMFVSRRINAGSRLRLVVGAINSIYSQKNYNGGGDVSAESIKDARTVTIKVFHDAQHPSTVVVPFGHERVEYV